MNTRPEAVTMGPPKLGMPIAPEEILLNGTMSSVVPSGTDHRILPVCMSMACSRPQGGGLHGRPSGESIASRFMPNGAPACGETSLSEEPLLAARKIPCGRDQRDQVDGAGRVDVDDVAPGSKARPPQFAPPPVKG